MKDHSLENYQNMYLQTLRCLYSSVMGTVREYHVFAGDGTTCGHSALLTLGDS